MTISVDDRLPDVTFRRIGADGPEALSTADVFAGRRIAMFGVPGAFTPTCHNKHLPGFVALADSFRTRGVDDIVCLSVNDIFVLDAWAKASGADGKITFLSDWNAEFARLTGLDVDRSATLGVRLRRFAMLVEDGIVKSLEVDDVPGQVEGTSAASLLNTL